MRLRSLRAANGFRPCTFKIQLNTTTDVRFATFLPYFVLIFGSALLAAGLDPKPDAAKKAQQLKSLFTEEWEHELLASPETATALGDNRYNDRLSDNSPEFTQSELKEDHKFLARFDATDPAGLSSQAKLSRELMIRKLREDIEGAEFKPWEMPVNQRDGLHLWLIDLVTLTPFKT